VPDRNRMHFIAFSWVFSTLVSRKSHKVTIDEGIDEVLPGSAKSGMLHNFLNAMKADSGIEVGSWQLFATRHRDGITTIDRLMITKCSRAVDVTLSTAASNLPASSRYGSAREARILEITPRRRNFQNLAF